MWKPFDFLFSSALENLVIAQPLFAHSLFICFWVLGTGDAPNPQTEPTETVYQRRRCPYRHYTRKEIRHRIAQKAKRASWNTPDHGKKSFSNMNWPMRSKPSLSKFTRQNDLETKFNRNSPASFSFFLVRHMSGGWGTIVLRNILRK